MYCLSNNISFDISVLKMKVQLTLFLLSVLARGALQSPSSSFSYDCDFKWTVYNTMYKYCILGFGIVYMLYAIIKQDFIQNKSTALKNQRQSETSEPNYQFGSLLTQGGLILRLEWVDFN